jgi:hypothetical protein
MERNKLAFIITFAVDIILVLTMFLGLLRLRGRGRGVFGLARLLWKQVSRGNRRSQGIQPHNVFSVRKGVIWLLFATGTGLITVVSIPSFSCIFLLRRFIL